MYKITKRLRAAAEMLPKVHTVADIGCDHGLLSAFLAGKGLCRRVIAIDVSPFSVEKTERLAKELGLQDRIEVRRGDGFAALAPGEAGAAVLAGLGGQLIAALMDQAGPRFPLVLQPMQQTEILRKYLRTHGYGVLDERMVEENGRIHELMLVAPGEYPHLPEVPEAAADEVGPLLFARREPLLAKRLRIKAAAIERRALAPKTSREAREKLMEQVELLRTIAERIER